MKNDPSPSLLSQKHAPFTKVNNCRDFQARVILHGNNFGEAMALATELSKNENLQCVSMNTYLQCLYTYVFMDGYMHDIEM